MQTWEVKLHRRVIGAVSCCKSRIRRPSPRTPRRPACAACRRSDVNLQRGFVTVQSAAACRCASKRCRPRSSRPNGRASRARCSRTSPLRLRASPIGSSSPRFSLPLKLERHEAAKLLPARVNSITLTSVISDNGAMLTQVRLEMLPGDKRLLHLTLPKDAKFWFAFVNQNGVWPWREGDADSHPARTAIARQRQAIPVELFFSSQIAEADNGASICNCSRRSSTCRSRTSPGAFI